MNPPSFKVMADAYGKLGLYKRFQPASPGSMEGWELIAEEAEFHVVASAIKQAQWDEESAQEIFPT